MIGWEKGWEKGTSRDGKRDITDYEREKEREKGTSLIIGERKRKIGSRRRCICHIAPRRERNQPYANDQSAQESSQPSPCLRVSILRYCPRGMIPWQSLPMILLDGLARYPGVAGVCDSSGGLIRARSASKGLNFGPQITLACASGSEMRLNSGPTILSRTRRNRPSSGPG